MEQHLQTELCPFLGLNASAIVLLKPVICLGHTVICNKNNKDREQQKKKKKKSRHFILMSARFYLHTMRMIYFLEEVGEKKKSGQGERKEEEEWSVRPLRKEV